MTGCSGHGALPVIELIANNGCGAMSLAAIVSVIQAPVQMGHDNHAYPATVTAAIAKAAGIRRDSSFVVTATIAAYDTIKAVIHPNADIGHASFSTVAHAHPTTIGRTMHAWTKMK